MSCLVAGLCALSACARPVVSATAEGSAGPVVVATSSASGSRPTVSSVAPSTPPPTVAAGRIVGPAGLCPPEPTPNPRDLKIDYADFLQWGGRTYLEAATFAGERLGTVPTATPADLGPDVFAVKCSVQRWNDLTDARPIPGDGDAAFLEPGTPVAAMRGWPTECRLVARTASGLAVYLADKSDGLSLKPDPCALAAPTR